MSRENLGILQSLDLETDRTFHRGVRHNRNPSVHPTYYVSFPDPPDTLIFVHSDHSKHIVHSNHFDIHFDTNNVAQPPPHERTMNELTASKFTYDSLCIQYLEEEVSYVLKTRLIHLLPNFHGVASKDPCNHLKQFHIFYSTMKLADVQEDHVYLKVFPHSLEGNAKDWLYYLAPRSITSWDNFKTLFLEKFFPAFRTTTIRKEIFGIKQQSRESLYEY